MHACGIYVVMSECSESCAYRKELAVFRVLSYYLNADFNGRISVFHRHISLFRSKPVTKSMNIIK